MRKNKILRYAGITLLVVVGILAFLSITGTVAHAAGLVDDTVDAANQYSKYPLENYQLDFYVDSSWDWLPWNWLDGIGKSIQYGLYAITNFVWTVSMYISNATGMWYRRHTSWILYRTPQTQSARISRPLPVSMQAAFPHRGFTWVSCLSLCWWWVSMSPTQD